MKLLRHLVRLVVVVFLASLLSFAITNLLPGNPVAAKLGQSATAAQVAAMSRQLGLDRPVLERYGQWLGDAVRGNLGTSYANDEPVASLIAQRVPVSLELVVLAELLSLVVAIPLGLAAARKATRLLDSTLNTMAFAALAVPSYVIGVAAIYVLAVELHWLPATGFVPLSQGLPANLRSLLMPAVVLALVPTAINYRAVRGEAVELLRSDHILAAHAQGISPMRILMRYALRPAVVPMVTLAGMSVGVLISGAVIVEQLFAIPGAGSLLVSSITGEDYPVIQGLVVIIAVIYVLANIGSELLVMALDPRTRHGFA
jgi:peptide/nickel transport system permease protein